MLYEEMFGECHAHLIMDGLNYKDAISIHKDHVNDEVIRKHLKAYEELGIVFVRDGGDALGVSERARNWHQNMELIIVLLFLPSIKMDTMALSWEKVLTL
ncbi:MAG: hypothetical protein ACLURP_12690 [Ruminococcus sp.]